MYKLFIQSLLLATIAFPVNAANDLFDCERKVYSTHRLCRFRRYGQLLPKKATRL